MRRINRMTVLVLLLVPLASGAATVCKRVDAAGRVHFEDCQAPPRGAGASEQMDVEATRTGGTVASPARAGAVRERAEATRRAPAPATATAAANGGPAPLPVRPERFLNRAEEQAYLAALEQRCSEDYEQAKQAARAQRIAQCIADGEMDEARCRTFYRDWGNPVARPGGTWRPVAPPAACEAVDAARAKRQFPQ